jgi:hypothetical protein
MVDIGWHVGSPIRRSASPTRKPAYASAAAIIVMSCEHRGNDRALPARVTIPHDLTPAIVISTIASVTRLTSHGHCRASQHDHDEHR